MRIKLKHSTPSYRKQLTATLKKDVFVLTGDFNAKVGSRSSNNQVMRNNGLWKQNERVNVLLIFVMKMVP